MEDEDRPTQDAILEVLATFSHKLDALAEASATIAAGHRDLLTHAAASEARRAQDSADLNQRLDELMQEVRSIGAGLPGIGDDVTLRLTDHIDSALAAMLRLVDIRLAMLRRAFEEADAPASTNIEAGAVMGATQAAWNRLEQRIETEFDDLGRQLQSMASLIDAVVTSTEDLANRPVVSGEQLRKAASAVKETVVAANRSRRDRRGGPRKLGG